MKKPYLVSGLFIVVFLVIAAALTSAAIAKAEVSTQTPKLQTVLDGRWTSAYEGTFNKQHAVYDMSVNAWGLMNYVLFHEGKEGVLIGNKGWLFSKEEFDYFPQQQAQMDKNLRYISTVRDRLAQKNVKLLIALVPAKARIYEQYLGRYDFPAYRKALNSQIVSYLQAHNIAVTDLSGPLHEASLKTQVFLKTDTHWTPAGAEVAAKKIAQDLRAQWPDLDLPAQSFQTAYMPVETYKGDLLRYIPLGSYEDIGPQPDKLVPVETTVEQENGAQDASAALFSDEQIPVTLVGTSYSANEKWNFAGYLEQYLHTSVLNAAKEGMGPFETMKDYLSDQAFLNSPPQIVIWEIPERYLPVDYNLDI